MNIENIRIKELNLDLLQPNIQTMNDPDQGSQKTVIVGKPGCFQAGTEVLLYNGEIKKVEDIIAGERVMGWDSTPRTVLELCRNRDEMFKIVPEKGESYTVNLKHKLVLVSSSSELLEITVEEFMAKSERFRDNWRIFKRSVEFPTIPVDDPYTFGYSNIKDSIPREYKINSRENRVKLLSGILDNIRLKDGYVTDQSLINDIFFVFKTLGIQAVNKGQNGFTGFFTYEGEDLTSQNLLQFCKTSDYFFQTKFIIEPQGEGDYYGFTLDGDHKFLLASCDVVHNTGKSTLIGSLLYAKKHIYPCGVAFSGTEDSNHFYKTIFPSTFVFNTYDEDQIQKVIRRQKIAKEHLENAWAVMILDDCTDDPALFRKPLQQGLYKRGRHWRLWYILSLQYGMDVRPVIRTNVDGVFILREANLRNRKVMYENYAGIIPDFKLFCDILDQITDDYTALYIHNATRTNDWRDCVFWYKAKPAPKDFKFGCDTFWDHHFQRYNEEYVEPITV